MAAAKTKRCFMVSLILLMFLATCGSSTTSTSTVASADINCKPKPATSPHKEPPVNPFCPRNTLKLGVCSDLLGLVNVVVGSPPNRKCCSLLKGLGDLDVAACLCTAIKANVLGINLNVPVALSVLLSACGKTIPPGFKCV